MAIRVFSNALKTQFSKKLQPVFLRVSKNRFSALGLGAGATALMQSSTATTVLTVGLVNAGFVSLFGATAIIMGANVGTTLTSLLVSMSSFQIKYLFMAAGLIGLAVWINLAWVCGRQVAAPTDNAVCQKTKKLQKQKTIASLVAGFGFVFIGLELLSQAFSSSSFLQDFFSSLFSSITFPLLLILLGAVFTAVIQSSSASMAIYIALLASGVLPLSSAIFLLFGSEIGTCLTTLIASLKTNVNAKRAALVHLLFNLISAIIFTAIFWPLGNLILPVYTRIIADPIWQLSIFQVFYNIITVAILIWFIKPLNAFVIKILPNKESETLLCP